VPVQVVDGLRQVHEVHVAGEVERGAQRDAGSRPQPGVHHRGVVPHDRLVHVAVDHHRDGGRHAASRRALPSVSVGCLEVRHGCSLVVQVRWVVAPLVSTTEDWACDALRPPESAESCDVTLTHPESE